MVRNHMTVSMIAPIAGLAVKGAIWHQGYNNAMQPEGHVMYRQVFPKMIAAWRNEWGLICRGILATFAMRATIR